MITFQGTEDMIVPPSRPSRSLTRAAREEGPVCVCDLQGEQHGFRKAANIIHSLEAELYFYGRVFGFEPAGALAPVEIENCRWTSTSRRAQGRLRQRGRLARVGRKAKSEDEAIESFLPTERAMRRRSPRLGRLQTPKVCRVRSREG